MSCGCWIDKSSNIGSMSPTVGTREACAKVLSVVDKVRGAPRQFHRPEPDYGGGQIGGGSAYFFHARDASAATT